MALRLALGARAGQVAQLVLGQGLRWLTLLGTTLGLADFYGLRQVIASQLHDVTATDPDGSAVSLLLALVSLAACAVPSLRATRIEPMSSFRS